MVNDSRGFFANRCVGRYIAEGNEMFLEGVPPAMIENCAKMAGMPVGPLSLSDEVALDLGLKVMKATEADLGPNAVNPDQKKLMVELVEKQNRLRPQERQGLLRLSGEGQGGKRACGRVSPTCNRKKLDPDTLSVEELKQRFLVVQAVEAARTVEDHVITDMREADVGSILGFGFAPFTGGTLSYIDFMGTKKFVELCHKLEAQIRLALHAARNCWKRWPPRARPSTAASRRRRWRHRYQRRRNCRPCERRDPYAAAYRCRVGKLVTFCNNHGRWLWVPAFAGTTEG